MSFKTDGEYIQDLLPIRMFSAIILHGIDDPHGPEAKQITAWLREAEADVLASALPNKVDSLKRRAWRLHDVILKPFQEEETAVAKFALIVFYVLDQVRKHGLLNFPEDGPLDKAISAVLAEDGTVSEQANIEKVDNSAQKQARKLFAVIQAEGYYRGLQWQ